MNVRRVLHCGCDYKDGRFDADQETFKPQMHGGRSLFVNLHKQDYKDVQHWMDKRVCLNIAQFLLSAAAC